MRILFLFNGVYPNGMAMCKRLHLYAKGLLEHGNNPEVFFPSDNGSQSKGYYEGVQFSSYRNPAFSNHFILRPINRFFASFYYAHFCYISAKKYKIIFTTSFGWFTDLLIIIGAHFGDAKVVIELNENPYSPEGGRLDPEWLRKVRRLLTLNLPFRVADGFIVISKSLEDLVCKFKKNSAQVIRVPIIVEDINTDDTDKTRPEHPYILHAGALSETKDGMIAVFEAFAEACKRTPIPLRFIFTINIMSPKLKRKIDRIIAQNGLEDRVLFKGLLSVKEVDKLRASSAMAIVNKPSNWQNDYNFPTKLGELLITGTPVIASSTGEMNRYLSDNETAFMVPANESNAIAKKIIYILNNPDIALKVGNNGRKLALESFHYTHYSKRLADFFNRVSV